MAAGMTTPRSFAPGEIPASPRAVSESFDEIFSNKGKVQTKPPCSFRGEPAVFFTKEEIVSLISPFRFTLVGKFPLWQPSIETVRRFFSSLELKSLKSVGLLHDNHIVIFINCEEDYSRLLIRSTWYVYGAPLKIQKWTPDYVPSFESPIVPVWVGFPYLPIHFFDKSALFNIASLFGTPLKVDEPTALLSKPTVARVCIEMDISKPRKESFWIGSEKDGFWQEVVYENPPLYCDCCKVFEHVVDSCLFLQPELKKEKEMEEIRGKNTKKAIFQEPTCAVSKKENVAEVELMPKENQFSFVTDQKDEWQIKKFGKWKQKMIPADIPVAPVVEAASTAGSPAEPSADSRFRVVASPSAPFSKGVFVTPPNPNRLSPNFKSKVKERRGQPLDQEISIFQPLDRTEMPKSGNLKSYGVVNNSGSLDIFCKNFQSLDQSKGDKETGLVFNDGPVKKISAIKSSPSFSLDDNGLILKDGSVKSVAEIDSSPLDLLPNGLAPLYFSSSLDPMLEESQFGPNPNLQTNSTGQIAIPFPDESLSQIISSREKKVYPRYSLLHLKSFIFSSLRDQGIDLNPSLENGICDFLAFVAPKLYEENSYITWYFIQQRLISYLIDSKIFVSKKLRKAFGVFFTKSCNENQSTRLLENCVEDSPTSDEER